MTRFVVIADTHFYAGGNERDGGWWNRTLSSRSREVGHCMVETLHAFAPDFVIHCGDLIGQDDLRNWEAALAIMGRLDCPWYGTIGNHETWNPGVRAAFASYFGLPGEQCYYTKTLGGIRFLFLDTCHWRSAGGICSPYLDKELFDSGQIDGLAVPDKEFLWLGAELEAAGDRPVCLVSHAPLGFKPLYPVGTLPKGRLAPPGGMPLEKFNDRAGNSGDIVNRGEVRAAMARHACVRAAFAGHAHIHDFHWEQGVGFCMTGSMREYPFEFRLVELAEGAAGPLMRVTTHDLRNASYAEESLVSEWHNGWVAGAASDRTFDIPIGRTG